MIWLFIFVCLFAIVVSYFIDRRVINVVTVLVLPYLVIVVINNFIMTDYGFYMISDNTLSMLGLGIFCYFCGSFLAENKKIIKIGPIKIKRVGSILLQKEDSDKFAQFNLVRCYKYVLVVEIICWLRFLLIVMQKGVSYLGTEDFSGVMFSGPLGHLLLTIYPLIPILFLYWLKNKKKVICLLVTALGVGLCFLSMVKYHAIGMIVLIYLFCAFEDKKYLKKGAVILVVLAVAFFVGNYFMSFSIRGVTSNLKENYYLEHLWNYIAGSLIYDNRIFTDGIKVGVSTIYKLGTFAFGFPNMFLSAIFGISVCPHTALEHMAVGTNGEMGNVIDAMGYLYPSQGSWIEIVFWMLVLVGFGFLFTKIYNRSLRKNTRFHISLCTFLTFFVFFSFFGTFYINPTPWEILIYSAIVPCFFDGRIKLFLGK